MEKNNKYNIGHNDYQQLLGICVGLREAVTIIQDGRKTERLFPNLK